MTSILADALHIGDQPKLRRLVVALGLAFASGTVFAQATLDTQAAATAITVADNGDASHTGNVTPPLDTGTRQGPLAGLGTLLNGWGISPTLNLVQMYLDNPNAGQETGKHEALTFISVGADFDMQKIAGFPGATIHFQQLFVPFTTNLAWGTQVGDVLGGQPGPYVPQVSHLTTFTWEQKAFHDKLDVEFGKSNAGNYFGLPVCNQGFGCQSAILQDNARMNPPPYANWGARARYDFAPGWSAQVGMWRADPAFPFTNGWEWTDSVPDSNTFLANVTYHSSYQTDPYPKSYELMYFHNSATQTDPLTSATHKGTSGMYFGGRQVIYRPDGGQSGISDPTALSAFVSMTSSFDSHATTGLAMTGSTGLILEAPFRSRSHDSYSLSFNWATLTSSEQALLGEQNLAAGGSGYGVGRTEMGLRLDANLPVTRSIILSPYVLRTWHTNTWGNADYGQTPKNGFVVGVLGVVLFDQMLGLVGH